MKSEPPHVGCYDLKAVLGCLLLFKLCFFFLAVSSIEFLPVFRVEVFERLMSWPREGAPTWESHFATWDGAHYLSIAKEGYVAGSESCAFYPLWPFLIRSYSFLFFGHHFWAGIVLANCLSICGLLLFHRLVVELEGIEVANRSLILLLAFPGAIFLSFIYTEPLFFLLSIVFFLLLFRKRYWLAAAIAFFLPLTKAIGAFAAVPLAWQLWSGRRPCRTWLCLASPCLGYLCYFLTMQLWTGNAFEGFEAQKQFPTQPSIWKIFDIAGFAKAFASVTSVHSSTGSMIDRVFFVLLLACLPAIFRRNTALGLYTILVGIVPATSASLISYSRNMMMCFPIFMVLARVLSGNERREMFWYAVALLGSLQVCFLIRYLNFYWAG